MHPFTRSLAVLVALATVGIAQAGIWTGNPPSGTAAFFALEVEYGPDILAAWVHLDEMRARACDGPLVHSVVIDETVDLAQGGYVALPPGDWCSVVAVADTPIAVVRQSSAGPYTESMTLAEAADDPSLTLTERIDE